jgi:hypothetical protein
MRVGGALPFPKKFWVRTSFLCFLAESKLPIEPSSVEKCLPPEPDILCHHKVEGAVAFELVEICDPILAEFMSTVTEGGVTYIRTSDPSSGVVRRKLRRTYNTEAPIELLCYTAGRIITPDDVIVPTIKPWFSGRRHAFRRAWLLGESSVQVVWAAG